MSTPTTSLLLQEINTGDQSGTWGTSVNTNMQLIDDSIAGVSSITFNGSNNYTLSNINYASDEARKMVIIANGSPGSFNQIVAPLVTKLYVVINRTNVAITIGATTGATVSIPYTSTASAMIVYCDGTNFYPASNSTSGTFTASIFSGAGTGLTGTAAGLSIGGNAATATSATTATNIANGAAGYIPYQTSSGNTSFLALGTSSYVLTAGSTAPQYVSQGSLSVGNSLQATNLNNGSAGQIAYQTNANTTGFLALGTTNYVLTAGASAPQYVAQSTLSVGSAVSATTATTATNIAGGTAGSIVYQTGSGSTSTLGLGTTNYVLTAGVSAPQYVAQSTLSVGSATTATTSTNLASGSSNQIPYQTTAGTTSFITAPTTGVTYLSWNGSSFSWAAAGSSSTTYSATFNSSGSGASSGTAFNNSANVTISYNTIGASPLAGSTNITTLGTISTGTWQGSVIQPAYIATLNQNTTGNAATATNPQSGGSFITSSNIGSQSVSFATTAGSATNSTNATNATYSTNIAGGAANQILYQTGVNATGFIAAPSANTVLYYNGSAFSWITGATPLANGCVYENGQTITSNYTMTSGNNGQSAGPITVATGVTVTIPTGSNWVIN